MTPVRTCPTLPVLEDFAAGRCTDESVAAHVAACSECSSAVHTAREMNTFLAGVRPVLAQTGSDPVTQAPRHPITPDLVPGYRILEEIHRGGQGVVYRALQVQTQRIVAIKTLLAGHGATSRDRERFEREARIAAALRHPNIVTVYDSVLIPDGRLAFAMEHIEGEPLDRWSAGLTSTRNDRRRVLRDRLTIMAKVCDAVLYAHQHAIVHRDLKPANILVDAAGEPHVLDFGIARDIGPDERTRLTQPGGFAGTLAYASPEQVSGDPSRVDTRTDIYALGVILYEMVTGRMPYAVDPMSTAIRNIEKAEPEPLSRRTRDGHGPFADDEVSTIILKAMTKDPARRYQTAAALGNDIIRYLAGEAIEARRDSTWYVLRKFARRRRWLLTAASMIVLALAAGSVAAGYGLLQARDERLRTELERTRAESEALAGRAAARLIQQTLLPFEGTPDDAALGRYMRAGLTRLQSKLEIGALAGDAEAEAAARKLFVSVLVTPQTLPVAEVQLRQTIAALHYQHGDESLLMAQTYQDLAGILERRGRDIEAERWARQAIDLRHRIIGKPDPISAASSHLLARLLIKKGDPLAADIACTEAIDVLRDHTRAHDAEYVWACLTQAAIRSMQGRHTEAETAAGEALLAALTSLSDEDPLLIQCLRRIAELYSAQPDLVPDVRLCTALKVSSRQGISEILLDAATDIGVSGHSTADRRQHSDGLEIILALKSAYLGKDHMACAVTLALIVDDRRNSLDWGGVVEAADRSIVVLETCLGRDHPALIQPNRLVWEGCLYRDDVTRALKARRRMLDIWRAQSEKAKDSLWIANEHRWLAHTLALGGLHLEAEQEFRAALDHLTVGGLTHHYLADICTGGLGSAAVDLGRVEEGESLIRGALARYASRPDAPLDQKLWLERHLGHALIARGQFEQAKRHIDTALANLPHSAEGNASARRIIMDAIEIAEHTGDHATAALLETDLARRRVHPQARPTEGAK